MKKKIIIGMIVAVIICVMYFVIYPLLTNNRPTDACESSYGPDYNAVKHYKNWYCCKDSTFSESDCFLAN